MCLVDPTYKDSRVVPLVSRNPLDKLCKELRRSQQCFCTGRGADGLCKCERMQAACDANGGYIIPKNIKQFVREVYCGAKPRIRVKAGSRRW